MDSPNPNRPGFALSATEDLGAMVSPRSPPLFVIAAPITRLKLTVPIPEADVGAIRTGQTAQFSVPAFPGRTFSAQVEELDIEPQREAAGKAELGLFRQHMES